MAVYEDGQRRDYRCIKIGNGRADCAFGFDLGAVAA